MNFYDKHPDKEIGLIFLDAEKAFDNLSLSFMIEMLKKMETGEMFLNAIRAIFRDQQSHLIINSEPSDSFAIGKGTSQGCPLSPLLFIFILEVLLRNIKENKNIPGLKIRKHIYKPCFCG